MSLVNWNLTPSKVELSTDTLAYNAAGAALFKTTKFFCLPHARIVIADQGAAESAFELQKRALGCDLEHGIDDLAARGPEWLAQIHADWLRRYGEFVDHRLHQNLWGVVAFGWSSMRKRMRGIAFAFEGFAATDVADGESFNPAVTPQTITRSDPRVQAVMRRRKLELLKFRSPATFIAMAELQQIVCQDHMGYGCGGDLLLCTLTEHEMNVRKIFAFPQQIGRSPVLVEAPPPTGAGEIAVKEEADAVA